jgi:hypothetical protein
MLQCIFVSEYFFIDLHKLQNLSFNQAVIFLCFQFYQRNILEIAKKKLSIFVVVSRIFGSAASADYSLSADTRKSDVVGSLILRIFRGARICFTLFLKRPQINVLGYKHAICDGDYGLFCTFLY